MLDPSVRSATAALNLFKNFLSGPQDLSFADAVNAPGRTVWHAFRAQTIWLYGLHWTRTLRPSLSRRIRSVSSASRALGFAVSAASPFLPLLDGAAARVWRKHKPLAAPVAPAAQIDETAMVAGLTDIIEGGILRPDYTAGALGWLLKRAAAKSVHGRLQTIGVHDGEGEFVGWYVYYLKPGETAVVLQIVAKPSEVNEVLNSLFHHAWQGGAIAVNGRLEPSVMPALSVRSDISYHLSETCMIAHARDPELLSTIHRGDALMTRLDGEWAMAFHGERL